MPIYEFHCPECNRTFEKISPFGMAEQPCPDCGKSSPKRISVPAKSPMGSAATGPPPCAASCGKTSGFG